MDEKNEELVDAQIVEEDSRMYGHAEGEPGGEVADEPALVLGDDDPHDAELHEKILSEECAWKGKILDVHRLEVELPNGRRSARDIVRHPGAAAVVALTESGKIVLVRQYRTAIDRVTVEIPAGKLDPGEDPLDCAKRELHEETGFRAGRIRFLTSIVTSCGFCDEIIHIYLATKLEFDAPNPDDDEFVNVDLVPLHELIDAVLDGKIEDAKTVVGAFTKPRNESTLQTPLSGNLPFNRRSRTEVRVAPLSRHLARLGTFSLTLPEHRRYACWDALFSA